MASGSITYISAEHRKNHIYKAGQIKVKKKKVFFLFHSAFIRKKSRDKKGM